MGKMPWFRLYTEIRTDPKMQALSDAEFRIWINLLCLAAESKVRGVICIDQGIPYPDEALARAMYTDPDTLKGALAKFTKLRMVEIDDDGIIYLINFDARQYDKPSDRPEAVAERVRRHRAKAKAKAERQTVQEQEGATAKEGVSENDCNADVTPLKRQSNALDTDKETDKDSGVDITPPTPPKKNRPQTIEDILTRYPRYNSEQLAVIRSYWETIRFTRKTGKIAPNIVAKEMDYWERFPVEIVLEALDIHMRKYQSKREDYTAGIMRRLLKERELEGKGVKLNEQGRQPPRASPRADAGAGINLNKFLWKGT